MVVLELLLANHSIINCLIHSIIGLRAKQYYKWVSQSKFTYIQEPQLQANKIPIDIHSLGSQTKIVNQRSLVLTRRVKSYNSFTPYIACYTGESSTRVKIKKLPWPRSFRMNRLKADKAEGVRDRKFPWGECQQKQSERRKIWSCLFNYDFFQCQQTFEYLLGAKYFDRSWKCFPGLRTFTVETRMFDHPRL